MSRSEIQRSIQSFGIVKTLQDLVFRALNRIMFMKILKGVTICRVDPNFTRCAQNYRGLFLDQQLLMEFSVDPGNELPAEFLREALTTGDECYGFLDGRQLAAYGWYSKRPTPIDITDLLLHFDQHYIYMYKGFTHVNHRGQRLHAVGMTRALEAYLARGYKGIVSYVEWNNFASLKSCYRMGYTDFGSILVARIFGRYFIHRTAGCKPYGFWLEWRKTAGERRRNEPDRTTAAAGNSAVG